MTRLASCTCADAELRHPDRACVRQRKDDRATGRGVLYGALIGAAIWLLLIATIDHLL